MLYFLYCCYEMVHLDTKISGTTENNCANHSPGPSKRGLGGVVELLKNPLQGYGKTNCNKLIVKYCIPKYSNKIEHK